MKIFIINPDFGVTPEQMAARCHLLSVHVGPDVELHMECLVEIISKLILLLMPHLPRLRLSK